MSFFVGGEPEALLAASTSLHDAASRTDDVGRRLGGALSSAGTTILATIPFAPARALAVRNAVAEILASPTAGLGTVFAAYEAVSLHLRSAAQALEAAGAAGLLVSGGLGLLRGERPTVLASAEGVDLRREVVTGSWSTGPSGRGRSLAVREVRRPDGTTFFVVEATVMDEYAESAGVHVNGVGGFVEAGATRETLLRWAVPTRRDAELLLAAASGALAIGAGRFLSELPRPTETVRAGTLFAGAVGTPGPVAGVATASAATAIRHELTSLRSGGQRYTAVLSGGGQAGLLGVAGTGGAGAVKVTVDRNSAGAVQRISLATSTEVDRGRHGNPLLEAGNREARLVEREWQVELTPEARAAADRIAAAITRGDAPDPADVEALQGGARAATPAERTYATRHQQASVDVGLRAFDAGVGGSIDTAVLRREGPPDPTLRSRHG